MELLCTHVSYKMKIMASKIQTSYLNLLSIWIHFNFYCKEIPRQNNNKFTFRKMFKNNEITFSPMAKSYLNSTTCLQHLPPDVSHYAFNAESCCDGGKVSRGNCACTSHTYANLHCINVLYFLHLMYKRWTLNFHTGAPPSPNPKNVKNFSTPEREE